MDPFKKLTDLEKEAADFGFKWETTQQIMAQIKSEIAEIEVHLNDQDQLKLQDEIGDLLHAVCSLCVFCEIDPEKTLIHSIKKFEKRFRAVQQLARQEGLTTLQGQSFQKLMALWDQAKKIL